MHPEVALGGAVLRGCCRCASGTAGAEMSCSEPCEATQDSILDPFGQVVLAPERHSYGLPPSSLVKEIDDTVEA
jgi:hypothetical protein